MRRLRGAFLGLAIVVLVMAVGTIGAIFYVNRPKKDTPIVYDSNQMLLELWNNYKNDNIEPSSNRTLDKQSNNITTSEGESYTMTRAVWIDDQVTFDKSLQWTKDNLQRDDHLLSWKFGKLPNGKYDVQRSIGGQNTASDGDTDVAFSLLMAYSRWQQDKYLYDATAMIDQIWKKEVVMINKKPVLVANDIERKNPDKAIVNPSYFAPYAYKAFAKVDKKHDWKGLVDNSYHILSQASKSKLNSVKSSGLPPDWISINRNTGKLSPTSSSGLTTNFSFDAIRVPWRLALDYQWHKDPRDKQVLSQFYFLKDQWQSKGKIVANYNHDGTPAADYESPATYGATIGYFKVIAPKLAKDIYQKKLSSLYDPDKQKLAQPLSYYDDNWSWFGSALVLGGTPNLIAADTE